MNKLRDFIYDKSDIVVALLIISIAGLIVFSRIEAILSYPETFAASIKPPVVSAPAVYVGDKDTTSSAAIEDDVVEMLAIYINYGESLQSVAEKFVSVDLFSTSEEFLSVIEDAGVQTQVKTGNFIIPANATDEEVIDIITRPGL
ncbi:MAG: hypothetical protein JJE49_08870 [Peptostreptococcaceae bacterium]|nr:hypothetical protein [Peptostreptococcaceae bacterium]